MNILPTPKECANPGRPLNLLDEVLHPQVTGWLPLKVKDLVLDYLIIKANFMEHGIGSSSLSDFSYLITPAFKALEGTLIRIAEQLGFPLKEANYSVGVVFSEERLEKYYRDTLDKLESLATEKKLDVKQWLDNARRILHHMRHAPAHYGAEGKKTYTAAFQTGEMILGTINEMCRSLLAAGLLKPDPAATMLEITGLKRLSASAP
jgi:hypothetical protein